MAKRPDLPSTFSAPRPQAGAAADSDARRGAPARRDSRTGPNRAGRAAVAARIDVRGWLGGIRLSAFMMIMLCLVVFAVLVLVPTVSTYVGQRQRIASLEESVQVTQEQVTELEAERDRWGDRSYIVTQARERLSYHRPGELVYIIDNDLPEADVPDEQAPVSADVEQEHSDWGVTLLRSITTAGQTRNAVSDEAE